MVMKGMVVRGFWFEGGQIDYDVFCATGNIVDTSDREHRLQLSPYGCLRVFRGFRVYSSSTGLRFA